MKVICFYRKGYQLRKALEARKMYLIGELTRLCNKTDINCDKIWWIVEELKYINTNL
jgi:hypothetical protein